MARNVAGSGKLLKKIALFISFSCAVSGGVAHAATYYVSRAGNDNNSCERATSVSTPKASVNAGISCLSGGGDTLLIRSGTYDEHIGHTGSSGAFPSGTSWSNKVRIANYPSETVWLRPSTGFNVVLWLGGNARYVEFDGINIDATLVFGSPIASGGDSRMPPVEYIRFQNSEYIIGDCTKRGEGQCESDGVGLGFHRVGDPTNHLEVLNNVIHGQSHGLGYGIYSATPDHLIEGNEIYDVSNGGFALYGAGVTCACRNIIRGNRVHDITGSGDPFPNGGRLFGMTITGDDNQIYNNLFYNNHISVGGQHEMIHILAGTGNKIWNNTFYNNDAEGIRLISEGLGGGVFSTEIRNNIFYLGTGPSLIDYGKGTVQSNNLFDVDPLFVKPSVGNFELQPASRAIDTGTSVAIKTDFAGIGRPEGGAFDIGAYEYRPTQSVSPPPTPTGLRIVGN